MLVESLFFGLLAIPQDMDASSLLESLGLVMGSERGKEILDIENDFVRLAGDKITKIKRDVFISDAIARHLSLKEAEAAFRTFDLDRTNDINIDEYTLYRVSTTNYMTDRDNETVIVDFRLQMVFSIYDRDKNNILEANELQEMIRDMAAGEGHVKFLVEKMGITEGTTCDLKNFLSNRKVFRECQLRTRDILRPTTTDPFLSLRQGDDRYALQPTQRVVIHPRALTAGGGRVESFQSGGEGGSAEEDFDRPKKMCRLVSTKIDPAAWYLYSINTVITLP